MMKLSTMARIMATCDVDGGSPLAEVFVAGWRGDTGSARFFRVSANCLFTFTRGGVRHFLRVNHADERRAEAIEAELTFIRFVASRGVAVAAPVPSIRGAWVETIETPLGPLLGVVFEAAPGRQLDDACALRESELESWGWALGHLHQAADGYPGDGRPTWRDHLAGVRGQLPAEELAALGELEDLQAALDALPADGLPCGLIHYDFELDNLIWHAGAATIIDFDDCAWYPLVADIAFALRDLVDDRPERWDLDDPRLAAFVRGYRAQHAISDDALQQIPLFARLHNLTCFARLHRALEDGPQAGEPPWMPGLRDKLLGAMAWRRDAFAARAEVSASAPRE